MSGDTESRLSGADIGVLISYFILVILIGIFAMYRANRSTVGGYFLAGRSMWFLPIGASLFVSNIGTEHFIGLAGSGAASGISVGAWEFNALLILQLLGWVFLPVYIACRTYTMPEYLAKRFGGSRLRVYYAVLSLILYIFTKCSSDLYTGALFIQQSLRWDLYVSIIGLVLITAILTITGGLTAVIYTDTLQATLMVGGALYLMGAGFYEIGGFSGLLEKYPQAVPTNVSAIVPGTTCHHPDPQSFRMLRGVSDNYMPWLGFLLGQTPGSIWYWCTDQVIVQRALAAKSISHAQGATVMAGFIKILPLFFMVIPGMISRILYPDEVACTNPEYCMSVCQSRAGCSSIAYPRLVMGLMPNGARGLMMAVIVAALMSDLDSIFNSASTLFTIDIWKKIRKRASVTEQMIVGRLFILVLVAVSVAWVPVIKETQKGQVFIYINEVINYLAPPFSAVFLLGILVPRVNEKGVFWALMYAFVVGVTRLTIAFVFQGESHCGSESTTSLPVIISNFHYMYFALFAFSSTGIIALVISYLTEPPPKHCLEMTTLWSYYKRTKEDTQDTEVDLKMLNADKSDLESFLPAHDTTSQHTEVETTTDDKNDTAQDASNTPVQLTEVDTTENKNDTPALALNDNAIEDKGDKHIHIKARAHPILPRRILNYILGISYHDDSDDKDQALKDHMATMASLKQTTMEKTLLTAGLLVILAIGVAMFLFWSLYRFPSAPFYPNGATSLLPGDEAFVEGYIKNISNNTNDTLPSV